MATVHKGRFTAQIEGEFVVFLIGMRINHLFLIHKWLPVAMAMPRMLKELFTHKEMGMLHAYAAIGGRTLMTVQYWRSFEQLHAYAHAKNLAHLPAWADFNRRVRRQWCGRDLSRNLCRETRHVRMCICQHAGLRSSSCRRDGARYRPHAGCEVAHDRLR